MIFLGELHRDDSLALRYAMDSLLQAHGTDSIAFLNAAQALTEDGNTTKEMYRKLIFRFENMSDSDSSRDIPEWQNLY